MRLLKKSRGFTLTEMLVVLGLVGLFSSLAITNVVRNRLIANESVALNLLISLRTACVSYYSANNHLPEAFPQKFEDLATSTPPFMDPGLIEAIKSQRVHQGYWYLYQRLGNNQGFTIMARPANYGTSGNRSFFMDRKGEIFVTEEDREPNPDTDPTL